MYREAEPTLTGQLTPELLAGFVRRLHKGAYVPKDQERGPPPAIIDAEAFTGVKNGA